MTTPLHFRSWPEGLPRHLTPAETSLFYNLEVSATRFPGKPCLIFYGTPIAFAELKEEAELLAGFLEKECAVRKGDRVLLLLQNSPQFVLAYYAVLRANAVVVPVSSMSVTDELRHYVQDSGCRTAIVGQELYPQMRPLLGSGLDSAVVAAYSDYLKEPTDLRVPDFVRAGRQEIRDAGVTLWGSALARGLRPGPLAVGPDDLCVMPYTSGTTGRPKGCMHTHRTAMHTIMGGVQWFGGNQDAVTLAVLPFFHVTGMQGGMNMPLFSGSTVVLLPRWDREVAGMLIERHRVTSWTAVPTMVVDFLSNPNIDRFDLSSISRMSGGGAAMPEAIAQRLHDLCGLTYVEGYGLSETIAATHINPPRRPKKHCLGIPVFDVDARVVDPESLRELPQGEVGEILIHGPQVFRGYWNDPRATADAFVEIDGRRFLRTGDLGRIDEDGYFFMVDRLKRMINCSGLKVWPAEVEAALYHHPAIREACVIAARDSYRGETVKAVVVLHDEARGKVSERDIIEWASSRMAAYKHPRLVEFADSLPRSASGKVQWRVLQESERAKG
jgi:fatty-acyl-CoA synthase